MKATKHPKHPVYGYLTEQEFKAMIAAAYGGKDYYIKLAKKREAENKKGKKA